MQNKRATSRKIGQKVLPQAEWNILDTKSLELRYNYGNSVVAQFVAGHNHAHVLRELVQNEYDAGGSRLQVAFHTDELRILGNGIPIDAGGWRRLSVMLGTGQVWGSEYTIEQKVNGIGSKNFGLRSLFLYGDQIHIRSGGLQTVLDFSGGTLPKPMPEPGSKNVQGIDIIVPYRKRKCNGLEPFDAAHEDQALENFTTNLTSVLMKLAQPGAPKSLRQVEISSERCDRFLLLKETVSVLSQHKGLTIVRRAIHLDDSKLSDSQVKRHTNEEVEFQRSIPLPQQYRDQAIPGYFKVPRGRIRIAVSMRKRGKKIDFEQPGHYYYPLGATNAYTGNAISINAPFQMNADRSQIIEPEINGFNAWLLDKATDLTFELLTSCWWQEFGSDSYLSLQKKANPASTYFLERVVNRLEKDPCWPTRVSHKGTKRPRFTSVKGIVVPDHHELDGFLSDECYLDDTLGKNVAIQRMTKERGAKTFGISSLVRLRCAGSDKTQLATKLANGESNWFYTDFPDALKEESLQLKFAKALDALASHLSPQNREDLKKSPTTLAADGSLQAPANLWVVDPAIASTCPIPASERLHPTLASCKILVRLCKKYEAKKWIWNTAQEIQDGTAAEDQRSALYHYILATHGHFDRKTWALLRKTQVLRDHRNAWVMPKNITLRKAPGATQLEAALHFPHPDYENDKVLAEALRFKKKISGEDIVRYAHIVATHTELAPEFEETLQRFSRLLTKQECEKLKTVSFLQSSQGKLAPPSTLYLRTPRNVACLGDDATFVAGTRITLYKHLDCIEQPKLEDILHFLTKLRSHGIKPTQPEILYPTLVAALKAKNLPTFYYKSHPIIWDGLGYSKPEDMLLGNKYLLNFLKAVRLVDEASPALSQALRSLGVPSEPQTQHWQKLLDWVHQRYVRSGEPLTHLERRALHEAYNHLTEMPRGTTADTKCLLDRNGRLHSLNELRANRYLLNDDPALAQAITEKGISLAFADIDASLQASDLRFYHGIGISSLTDVREQIGCSIGTEKMPPPWCDHVSVIKRLHDRSFLSALKSLADYQLHEHRDQLHEPSTLLQAVQSLVFAQSLYVEYRVGSVCVSVPTDVVLDGERIVLAEVQSHNELDELLSQAIAGLFVRTPSEQRQFSDADHPDLAVRQHFGDFTSGFSHQFGVALSIMAMSDAFRIPWGKLTPIPVHRRKVLDYTAKIPNTNSWLHLEAKGVTSDSSRANARRSIYNKKDDAHKQVTNHQVAMIGTIIQAVQRGRGAIAKGLIEVIDPDDDSDPVVFQDNYQKAGLYWHFVGVAIFAGLYQVAEEFIKRADSLIRRQSVSISMSTFPFKEVSIFESHGHRIIGVQWQPGDSNNFPGNMWFYQGVDIDIILNILAHDIFPNTHPYSDLEFLFTHNDSVESILPDGSYFGIGTRPNTSLVTVSPRETDIWNVSF